MRVERWWLLVSKRTAVWAFVLPLYCWHESLAAQTITGQVVNGTKGGGSVAGLEVLLTNHSAKNHGVAIAKARTDTHGGFEFPVTALAKEHTLVASVQFCGLQYDSQPMVLKDPARAAPIKLHVFDTTTARDSIRIVRHHVILHKVEGKLAVTEMLALENAGDRTLVRDSKTSRGGLRVSLPKDAAEARTEEDPMASGLAVTGTEIQDTGEFPPGEKELSFSYILPVQFGKATWEKKVDYPTDKIMVVPAGHGLELVRSSLPERKIMPMSSDKREYFKGEGLPAGGMVSATVAIAGSKSRTAWALTLGVIAAGVLALVLILVRTIGPGSPSQGQLEKKRQALIQEVAALDDAHEAGQVKDNEHRKKREALKKQILELTHQLQQDR